MNKSAYGVIFSAIVGITSSTSAFAVPAVTWSSINAVVDNVLSTTTLYTNTIPSGTTNGRLVWDPTEATSPGISVDNDTPPNSPPGATGCILAGGATCDDPRQSGKRYKLQATAAGPIDLVFDIDPNYAPVDGIYRIFGKIINAMPASMSGYTLELGTGVGSSFTRFTGTEGITFYTPLNDPPKEFELASVFPAGLFSPAGTPAGSGEGFFSADRSGFDLLYAPTVIQTNGIYGDYATFFGDALLTGSAVPDGYFFDDDSDPLTDDILQAWFDETAGQWLYGQADAFAPVDASTLATWALDPLYYVGAIDDLANTNLNASIVFSGATASSFTLRTTPSAVPVPAGIVLMGSVMAGAGALSALRRRATKQN